MIDYILKSPPVKLRWAGWESDTYTLHRHGWQLGVHERVYDNALDLVLKHPDLRARGIGRASVYYAEVLHDPRYYHEQLDINIELAQQITLADYSAMRHTGIRYQPIDPTPAVERINLDALTLFRELPPAERDIVVVEPSFDEILNMALKHQAPKQKELREKMRRKTGALISIAA